MFDKVEFSDLYKFKTSIGLIIIVLGVILPWFFLRQDSELIISYEDYYNLIPESKALFDKKLNLSSNIIELIPYFSLALIILGILLTILGYSKWYSKQKIADATEQINYDNLKGGIKAQSSDEIKENANNDVKEEENYKSDQEVLDEDKLDAENSAINVTNNEEEKPSQEKLTNNLISMENLFLDKITSYNSFNYKIQSKVKIAKIYEVDFLLNAFNTKKYNDLIIEIKYLQSKLSMQLVRDSFNKGMAIHANYHNLTKRNNVFILIIIYNENIANESELARFKKAIQDFKSEIGTTHKIVLMSDQEVKDYKIEEIIQ